MARLVYCPVKSTPPVGRELNFEVSSSELHVHNDVHTLLNLKKKIEDANVINGFLSRMNQPNIEVSDVPAGNRFMPWLSDKLDAAKSELSQLKKAEDDAEKQKRYEEAKAEYDKLRDKYGF